MGVYIKRHYKIDRLRTVMLPQCLYLRPPIFHFTTLQLYPFSWILFFLLSIADHPL